MQKKSILVLLAFLVLFYGDALASSYRVLLISSYHPAFPTFFQQIKGIQNAFDGLEVQFDVEFMDSKRFYEQVNLNLFDKLLEHKLAQIKPYHVVLTSDDNAFHYALKNRSRLFPGIPLVFLGVNNVPLALEKSEQDDITGVIEAPSFLETFKIIESIIPGYTETVIVSDATVSGQADLKNVRQLLLKSPEIRTKELLLNDLSFNEFADSLTELKQGQAVLLLSAYKDRNGTTVLFQEGLDKITTRSPVPVFHLWEHGLGTGALGGMIISHEKQGFLAGKIVASILGGSPVSKIPVVRSDRANIPMFDYRLLLKYNLPLDKLPDNSQFIHLPPPSVWVTHAKEMVTITFVFITLITALVISVLNIRKRKFTEKQLLENQQRLQNFIEQASDAIFIIKDGYIKECNRQACELLQRKYSDVLNKTITELSPIHQDIGVLSETAAGKFTDKISTDKSKLFEWVFKLPDHSVVDTEVSLANIHIGKHFFVQAIVRDLSERKRMQQVIIQNEKMSSVAGLAAGIAHEINNPLSIIMQSTQILERRLTVSRPANVKKAENLDLDLGKVNEYFQMQGLDRMLGGIRDASWRAAQLIRSMTMFAKTSESKLIQVNLNQIIDEVVHLVVGGFEGTDNYDYKKIEINKNFGEIPSIYCRRSEISQVFISLIKNAARAMENNSSMKAPRMNIKTYQEDQYIVAEIEDNGCGMDEKTAQKLYEPFYTTGIVGEETGLGLSIVYFIVTHNHKGEISFKTNQGEGTRFFVRFPLE